MQVQLLARRTMSHATRPSPALAFGPDDAEPIRVRLDAAVRHRLPASLAGQEEDLVQVAHLRVLKKLSEPGSTVNARYLARVAYCVVVDELRRRREELSPAEDASTTARSAALDPEERTHGRQLGEAITACMGAMVATRRAVVGLYLQGHSVPQAARLLGYSLKKAENLVYRGLRDLRGCLEAKGVRP